MRRKIILGILAVVVLFIGYQIYLFRTTPPVSPLDEVSLKDGELEMSVSYSRPYKKGRLIFGEATEDETKKPLQAYGEYWRLGANAATKLTSNKDFTFAGEPVDAGSYRMYAIPGAETWELALNSDADAFLAFLEPDYEKDVLRVRLTPQSQSPEVEQLTIDFSSDSTGNAMNIVWDNIKLVVPIAAQ